MASKEMLNIGPEAKKDPKTVALDSIANIMEDILHDMKSKMEQTAHKSKDSANKEAPLQQKLREIGHLVTAPTKSTTVDLSGDRTSVKVKKIEAPSVKKVVKQDSKLKQSNNLVSDKKKKDISKILTPKVRSASIVSKQTVSHSDVIHPKIITTALIQQPRPKTEESKVCNGSRTNSFSRRRNNNQEIRGKSMNTTLTTKPNITPHTSKITTNRRAMTLPIKTTKEIKVIDKKQIVPKKHTSSVSNQMKRIVEQLKNKVNHSNKNIIVNQKRSNISKLKNVPNKNFNITNIKQLVLSTMRNENAKMQHNNKRINSINARIEKISLKSNSTSKGQKSPQNKPNNNNKPKTQAKSSNVKSKNALPSIASVSSKQTTLSQQNEHNVVVEQKDIIKTIIQTNRINIKPKIEQIQFLQELLPKIINLPFQTKKTSLPKEEEPIIESTKSEIIAQEKYVAIANAMATKQEKIIEFAKALVRQEMLETLEDEIKVDKGGQNSVTVPKNNQLKSQSVNTASANKSSGVIRSATLPIVKNFPTSLLKKIAEERKKYENKFKENIKEWKKENKKKDSTNSIVKKDSKLPVRHETQDTKIRNIENKVNEYQMENNKGGPPQKCVFKPLTQQYKLSFIKPIIKSIYPNTPPNRSNVSVLPVSNMQPIGRTISNKYLSPMEIIKDLVDMVNRAKRERKTFTVCGNFFSIRRAFAERGWVEKVRICVNEKDTWKKLEGLTNIELVEGLRDKEHGDKYRRVLLSKLLAGHQVDFYWDYITNPFIVNSDKIKRTIINRFPNGATRSYTTKPGLCESLKEAAWVYVEGFSNIMFPRTYNLHGDNERKSFIEDFRTTACISMLKWVNYKFSTDLASTIMSPDGKISISVYNFAVLQCQNILKCQCHKDIDIKIPEAKDNEWDTYLDRFYKIIHQNQHFLQSETMRVEGMVEQSRYILDRLREYFPQLNNDGMMNLWLLKPHYGSRGCGIHVCRTLKYMLETCHNRVDIQYIAQKYIERPLLIHDTKFDIRQYILVTSIPTLKIWMYKECYLKFSSQKFNLNRLDESVHLTNNSVQIKYKNCDRSNKLPDDNMWHSDEFRRYLIESGYPFAWRNVIYKGMKEILIGLFMLCQDKLITRVNSFELCGADFMIDENFQPYLLEINARPALGPSTKITARLCPKVLEDVVKVTVDNARNPNSSTGNFELILKDTWNFKVQKTPDLCVDGTACGLKEHEKPKLPLFKKEVHEKTNTIQTVFKVDPITVKKEPIRTLKQILSVISKTKNTINIESQTEKNRLFKCLMSEYVDIISGNANRSE